MLAHLYRGEMYRSKIWRTRLDATTNWAVATTGIALSVTFSNAGNSPLPLVLVALMSLIFFSIEGTSIPLFRHLADPGPDDGNGSVRTDTSW